jgi:hypothetical protein
LFLDFEHIERVKSHDRVMGHDTAWSRFFGASPHRAEGEAQLRRDFARVAPRFLTPKSLKRAGAATIPIKASHVRNQWYEGDLRRLAKHIGLEPEYDMWVGMFHGCIHSSIMGCNKGCIMGTELASFWASQTVAHALRLCLEFAGESLSPLHQAWLVEMTKEKLGSLPADVATKIRGTS